MKTDYNNYPIKEAARSAIVPDEDIDMDTNPFKEDLKRLCAVMINSGIIAAGYSQEELADLIGMTRGNVGHYTAGRRLPSLESFIKLIKLFGFEDKPISQILNFKVSHLINNFSKPLVYGCPILTWESAKNWPKNKQEIPIDEKLSEHLILDSNCYALQIKDNSMLNQLRGEGYHEGSFIIVNPDKTYKNKDLIVAKKEGLSELLFRKYTEDLAINKQFLNPLNLTEYERIQLTPDIKICGVVVAHLDILV